MLKGMDLERIRRRTPVLWLFMGLLVVLVCVLAVLQYRWIGEISANEQKRRQADLQAAADKLSSDFNAVLSTAAAALQPDDQEVQTLGRYQAYEKHYREWRASALHRRLFRSVAVVAQENGRLVLSLFDPNTLGLEAAEWPEEWLPAQDFIAGRLAGRNTSPFRNESSTLIDFPRFPSQPDALGRTLEQDWLLLDVDRNYAGGVILPELLSQELSADFRSQYRVEVVARTNPSQLIFGTDSRQAPSLSDSDGAQAVVTLFDPPRPSSRGLGAAAVPPRGFSRDSGRGRWMLSVWLRNGSLETVVASARRRNLAISAAILLLLLATGFALAQFSRRAQRLAEVEMEFVAGVSHELRTPLTVIRTAAFNLRGKMAANPAQVERYGALIQQESQRLSGIVEQILRFAGTKAGRVIQEREPVSVQDLIDQTLQSNKSMLEDALCGVETRIEPDLPPVPGDSLALRHALQNLLANAVKYGGAGRHPLRISAHRVPGSAGAQVEIRVADHGTGIPPDEQKHVFDAFFRGSKAVQQQVHGTGLGLHLVKKIVEAHGGSVRLESELGAGATFIVTLPAVPAKYQDELAHSLG